MFTSMFTLETKPLKKKKNPKASGNQSICQPVKSSLARSGAFSQLSSLHEFNSISLFAMEAPFLLVSKILLL